MDFWPGWCYDKTMSRVKEEFLDSFDGKDNRKAKKEYWDKYLSKSGYATKGYSIRIQHKGYNVYWVYLVHPR